MDLGGTFACLPACLCRIEKQHNPRLLPHPPTRYACIQTEAEICELNVPTGVPLVYDLDADMKPVPHKDAIKPLQGYYLGDLEKIKAKIAGVAAQTGKK